MRRPTKRVRCLAAIAAAAAYSAGFAGPASMPHAAAEGLRDHARSLQAVPADASFYAAWLRGAEQVEAAGKTNAWRRFVSIPFVQLGLMQVQTQWQFPTDPNLQAVKNLVEGPEGRELIKLLGEMVSEEVFIAGDESVARVLAVALEAQSLISREQYKAIGGAARGVPPGEANEMAFRKAMEFIADRKEDFVAPGIAIGFRIEDTARASRLLDRAEAELRKLAEQCPAPVNDELTREKAPGRDLLVLTLTEGMIPWREVEAEYDGPPQLLELARRVLAGKQAVVTLGVVNDFVVLALGNSTGAFEELGRGPLLVDTKHFEKLAEHDGERITSISYVSEDFMRLGSNERTVLDLTVLGESLLSEANLPEARREAIGADLKDFSDLVLGLLPKPGALAAVSFETERGYEAFSYNWTTVPPYVDGSKPLTIIDHLGADSLGWFASRSKQSLSDYDTTVGWVRKISEHFEAVAEAQADPAGWRRYVEVRDRIVPLLERLNKANRDSLVPAMRDGQAALVLDASMADKQWFEALPAAASELPLPSVAVLFGVSDAELLKRGAAEYFRVAQEAIDQAATAAPETVPALVIPEPEQSELAGGTTYRYTLPPATGASPRLAPNASLSDSVLVLSLLPELSEKLLTGGGVGLDGPVAAFDRPLVGASHFKVGKFLRLLSPWADYGIQVAIEQGGDEAAAQVGIAGMFKPQVEQLIEVLAVWDSYISVTYREGDAWVTHSESRIIDLAE